MRTKDMPHIFCTYLEELASRKQRQIDLADFDKSTHQLKQRSAALEVAVGAT